MNDINKISKTLLIGIGNYGRSDDAMGWKFLDEFSDQQDRFDLEYRYQLQIEDAELVSKYEQVIFVDASRNRIENGFSFYSCVTAPTSAFTTHQLNPETVLWLARELFDATPRAWVMAIAGSSWELHHGLSEDANENFNQAISYFRNKLKIKSSKLSMKAIL